MGILTEYLGEHPLVDVGSVMTYIHPDGPTAILKEGLICTYPIDDVIKALARIFDLKIIDKNGLHDAFYQIKSGMMETDCNGFICKNALNSEVLTFVVGNGMHNKDILDGYLNKYGYFLCNEVSWGDGWARLQYEKKFDTNITDLVKRNRYIYHICPDYLRDKITRQGITPHKSKFNGFRNDYRCYFFIKDFSFQNDIETNAYLLITIDTRKIEQDIKFYVDPRMDNGTYTLQGIGPNAIVDIEELYF